MPQTIFHTILIEEMISKYIFNGFTGLQVHMKKKFASINMNKKFKELIVNRRQNIYC